MTFDPRAQAYDPMRRPELFEGVPARRVVAFLIDMVIIASSLLLAGAIVLLLGLVTLGIGWGLFFLLAPPAWLVWAILYCGVTLGGPRSATLGMRLMDLEMRTYYGAPAYFVLGAVHAVFFWLSVSALTPFVLLVCFFNERRRLLHDILLGTVIVNDARRLAMLRGATAGGGLYKGL